MTHSRKTINLLLSFHSRCWLHRYLLWTSTRLMRIILVILFHPICKLLSTWVWRLERFFRVRSLGKFLREWGWVSGIFIFTLVNSWVSFSKLSGASFFRSNWAVSILPWECWKHVWESDLIIGVFIHLMPSATFLLISVQIY